MVFKTIVRCYKNNNVIDILIRQQVMWQRKFAQWQSLFKSCSNRFVFEIVEKVAVGHCLNLYISHSSQNLVL